MLQSSKLAHVIAALAACEVSRRSISSSERHRLRAKSFCFCDTGPALLYPFLFFTVVGILPASWKSTTSQHLHHMQRAHDRALSACLCCRGR